MNGTLICRAPEVLSRRVGAVWLVTTPEDPDVHELAGGAALMWERLAEPASADALVDEFAAAGAPRREVEGCLRLLRSIGALQEVTS